MVERFVVERVPGGPGEDDVVVEEPLEIRVEGQPTAITMRTPGHDLDLVAGFLWTEGVIDGADDLHAMAPVADNVVDVRLAAGVPPARARSADRAFFATSSCGMCGKASIERIQRTMPPLRPWRPDDVVIHTLPAALAAAQPTFARTGGLHAAALFDATGALRHPREDIGRHNAVDKTLGAALRAGDDVEALGLVVTSRAGFEVVQKALCVGVAVVVSVGAPSSLAVEAARASGATLLAWLRAGRYTIYAG